MEKSTRIAAQIYGYTVCVVAVITFLISVTTLVNAVIDRSDPIHAGWTQAGSPSLASFENYKMDIIKSLPENKGGTGASYVPDDATLRTMYQSAREDKIQSELHRANQNAFIGGLLLLISVVLFIMHWRWLRKFARMGSIVA